MIDLSKKNQLNELPVWADLKDILQVCKSGNLPRAKRDLYLFDALERMVTRLEVLEDNADELIAEKE